MDVTPRDLLCRPLAALKDNRAEAQQREHEFQNGVVESAIPTAQYRPGVFSVLDWLAPRLSFAQGGRGGLGLGLHRGDRARLLLRHSNVPGL